MVAVKDNKRLHATGLPAADVVIGNIRGVVHDVWVISGEDTVAFFRVEVRSQHWRQHVRDAGSFRRFIESSFVTVLDDFLEFAGRSTLGLHFCCVKEDPHLRLGARFIKGNRVKNIISIFRQGPGSLEGIIAGSSNKGVEFIGTLAGNFETLSRV